MKSLEEKKKLVKFARMLGETIEPELLESIEREEKLIKAMFKEEQPAAVETIIEVVEPVVEVVAPPEVAQTGVSEIRGPNKEDLIQQTINSISKTKLPAPSKETIGSKMQNSEFEGMKRQIAGIISKLGTLSMGGGGTGVVRIQDTDDFDRSSFSEGRFLKWSDGMFRLDEVNPFEVIHNVTAVTSATYSIVASDYYIGVNYAGATTITLPSSPSAGRTVVIKDESGQAQFYPIHIAGTIDNDTGGATIQINNGAIQLIFNNGWRII